MSIKTKVAKTVIKHTLGNMTNSSVRDLPPQEEPQIHVTIPENDQITPGEEFLVDRAKNRSVVIEDGSVEVIRASQLSQPPSVAQGPDRSGRF
ncbi:836_t:CDS:2 [Diversispora eburnea]|uniref:836_t:CDS:1 n=1 Tax=Diversispora eburnea TaxID=1213867 RepID=A0A9N8ZKT0_9GLOM|nr:836_t:CDS:2 [Diversispora eburnea]